jgi:hypothetical protein
MRPPASLVGILVLASLGLVAPRVAHGDIDGGDDGAGDVAALAAGGAVLYAAGTTAFIIHDLRTPEPSRGYGVAEALVNAPLTVVWGAVFVDVVTPRNAESRVEPAAAVLTAAATILHAALVVHGISTAGRHRPPPEPIEVGPVHARLVPTPVGDGRSPGAGLELVGSF